MTENTAQSLLDSLTSPKQVMDLSDEQLPLLAAELRKRIIDVVSKNGGHLAPSLGVVELTLALLHTFNMEQDKIVWDVGHQAYAYKLLTGRASQFHTLRTLGGLAGFPRRSESPYDRFGVGHSSTSISAALGMAMARDLAGGKEHVLAVIGDGSLTAGEAFEGLNLAGHMGRRLIVVLNDNEISISPNVGALSLFLSRTLSRRWVRQTRKDVLQLLRSIPRIGQKLALYAMRGEWSFKSFFTPGMLFEAFRFTYIGPVDGHDLPALCRHLQMAAAVEDGPVLLHVRTCKGKGYAPAEKDPTHFHGVGHFEPETGLLIPSSNKTPSFTGIFGKTLVELAEKDDRLLAITAAMPEGTGTNLFEERFPERFVDVGICEQHAVTFAAGLAASGFHPVVAIYSTFLQRAYDQILHDAAIGGLHVVLAVDRAGLVGDDGETHQGIYDVAFLGSIPGVTVYAPATNAELKAQLSKALYELPGVVALRYPRGSEPGREFGKDPGADWWLRETGSRLLAVSYGRTAAALCQAMDELPFPADFLKLNRILPLDGELVRKIAGYDRVVFFEEAERAGSVSEGLCLALAEAGFRGGFRAVTLPDGFIPQGKVPELLKTYHLDCGSMKTILSEEEALCRKPDWTSC